MPYTSVNDTSLPPNVRRLSDKRKRQWLDVYDSAKKDGVADGEAIHRANGVVMKQMGHSMAQGKHDADLGPDMQVMMGLAEVDLEAGLECGYDTVMMAPPLTQDEANYNPFGAHDGMGCATCRYFQSPQSCYLVMGTINPGGISDEYKAQPDYGAGDPPAFQLVDSDGDPVDFEDLFSSLTSGGMQSLEAGWHETWTAKYMNDLPDSSFAFIDPGGKKDKEGKTTPRSLRHFPYKDASGKLDEAHVRDAIGRVPQAHVSAVGKHQALVKLHAAARTLGIKLSADAPPAAAGGSSNEGTGTGPLAKVHNAFQGLMSWLGLEQQEQEQPTDADALPMLQLHEGTGTEPGPLLTPPGRLRYWAVATNSIDGDNKGQGFPAAAHYDYVNWVWEDPANRMPELQIWHTPGTRLGQADWIDFDGHWRHSTGLIDAGREDIARDLASDPDIAMSHGYVVVWDRHKRAKAYRSYEESVLPRKYAGNSYTSFGLQEVNVPFQDVRKDFLRTRGGVKVDADMSGMENRWEQFTSLLEGLGIGFHELELYVDSARYEQEVMAAQQAGLPIPPIPPAPVSVLVPSPVPAPVVGAHEGEQPPAAQPQGAPALATDSMSPESLQQMLGSMFQQHLQPIADRLTAVEGQQHSLSELLPNPRPQQPAGFDASSSARTVPAVVPTPNGATLGAHAADGLQTQPLDPRLLQTIAAGAQQGGQQIESGIGWLQDKLQGRHPMFNGQPTETRG